MEYILNDEQIDFMNKVHKLNDVRSDIDYIESKAIFERNNENREKSKVSNENNQVDMIKTKENIFTKIINVLKNIFWNK